MERKLRAGIYARVSSEEQAKAGFSIPEQLHRLKEHCSNKNYDVVGVYVDEGVSAYKDPRKRLDFQRMMRDVENDVMDIIVFVKLDRWFRNVKHYYLTQDKLDKNNVIWECSDEDYDVTTRSGKLNLNIKLAVGEDEALNSSERVRFVFKGKVRNGQAITGSQARGYAIAEDKTITKDSETEEEINAMFRHYFAGLNAYDTWVFIRDSYDPTVAYYTICRRLKNSAYTGRKDDNPNYRPAYITWEQHLFILKNFAKRTRKPQGQKTYLFNRLINCPECGNKLVSCTLNKKHQGYRCRLHNNKLGCGFSNTVQERYIEPILLNDLSKYIKGYQFNVHIKDKQNRQEAKEIDPTVFEGRLKRLNDIYMMGNISEEEYKIKSEELKLKIADLKVPKKKKQSIPQELQELLLNKQFDTLYKTLNANERRTFWQSIIEEIVVNNDGRIEDVKYIL